MLHSEIDAHVFKLVTWVLKKRIPVSFKIKVVKAKSVADDKCMTGFSASSGWLHKLFKHHVVQRSIRLHGMTFGVL